MVVGRMKKEDKHMDNLILTGWGWKEYAAPPP